MSLRDRKASWEMLEEAAGSSSAFGDDIMGNGACLASGAVKSMGWKRPRRDLG
jgi:hypothetical protein